MFPHKPCFHDWKLASDQTKLGLTLEDSSVSQFKNNIAQRQIAKNKRVSATTVHNNVKKYVGPLIPLAARMTRVCVEVPQDNTRP